MIFPDFVPGWFVEKHQELRGLAEFCRNPDEWGGCSVGRGQDAARYEAYAEAISRLLVSPDMASAWRILSTPSTTAKHPDVWDFLLWDTIEGALKEFDFLSDYGKTAASKRDSLNAIARQVETLSHSIASDKMAKRLSSQVLKYHLSARNIQFRHETGERFLESDFVPGLRLDCDVLEANQTDCDESDGGPWHKQPLTYRLAYWTDEAIKTTLDELLLVFSALLKEEAETEPGVKQPGRGKEAIKPLLIRRLNKYMNYQFGQPHDEIVARIVTLVLDLETPLTRDDVRPYVRKTGRKHP